MATLELVMRHFGGWFVKLWPKNKAGYDRVTREPPQSSESKMKGMASTLRNGTLANAKKLFSFLKMGRVNMWFLVLSVFLSVCYSLAALYCARLLLPLAGGIIQGDFHQVRNLEGVSFFVRRFPNLFNTSIRLFLLLAAWFYFVTIAKNAFLYLASLCSQIQARFATANVRRLLVEKCLGYSKSFFDKAKNLFR